MQEKMEITDLNVVDDDGALIWTAHAAFRTSDGTTHRIIVSAPFIPEQVITDLLGALKADASRVLDALSQIARAERPGS